MRRPSPIWWRACPWRWRGCSAAGRSDAAACRISPPLLCLELLAPAPGAAEGAGGGRPLARGAGRRGDRLHPPQWQGHRGALRRQHHAAGAGPGGDGGAPCHRTLLVLHVRTLPAGAEEAGRTLPHRPRDDRPRLFAAAAPRRCGRHGRQDLVRRALPRDGCEGRARPHAFLRRRAPAAEGRQRDCPMPISS